ncbi:MAG: hypothetical protein HXS44_15250 [Theionarchaea archaeon]|nr:hypothetical protein [Theionarchaea archaeon]
MRKFMYAGIFFTTLSLLMLEISLTRIFSVTMWYHFAFLAVSLAVFGMGAGGLIVYLVPSRFSLKKVHYYSFLCGLSMAAVLMVSLYVSLPLDVEYEALPLLLITYGVCCLPFFFGGICVSLVLFHESKNVSLIYFSDLLGSGMGCFLVILVLNSAGGPPSLLVCALCALTGTVFFSFFHKRFLWLILLIFLLFSSILVYPGEHLDIRMAKGFSQHHITTSRWNAFSHVSVFELGAPFTGWALSETWSAEVVDNLGMDIDANAFSPIVKDDDPRRESLLYDVTAVPFHVRTGSTLIIGSGGGRDIVTALLYDNTVTAVEINPLIVYLVNAEYGDYSGHIYDQVTFHIQDGRSFLEHSHDTYDIIQMSLVDTWAASASGAYALSETYLYTVEAFSAYIAHLTPDGILSISRWIFDKPQQTLRLVSLAREALQREGIEDASRHIIIVKNGRVATFLLKKTPFTDPEIRNIQNLCNKMDFNIVYTFYNRDNSIFAELITADDPQKFYERYPLNVEPSTDDSPFFFYTVKFSDLPQLLSLNLESESLKNNLALLWLFRLTIISFVLVSLFLLIPSIFLARDRLDKRLLFYFAFLGLGFMFVEIPLMQKFMLLLGNPTYAVSVVLFSLLISGGIGSYFTNRISCRSVRLFMIYSISLILFLALGFSFLAGYFLKSPLLIQVLLAIFLTSALGIAMGMPFPTGIKIVDSVSHNAIPWVWSINGAFSVLGSVLAIFLSINFGFSITLFAAAILYGGAVYFLSFYMR